MTTVESLKDECPHICAMSENIARGLGVSTGATPEEDGVGVAWEILIPMIAELIISLIQGCTDSEDRLEAWRRQMARRGSLGPIRRLRLNVRSGQWVRDKGLSFQSDDVSEAVLNELGTVSSEGLGEAYIEANAA